MKKEEHLLDNMLSHSVMSATESKHSCTSNQQYVKFKTQQYFIFFLLVLHMASCTSAERYCMIWSECICGHYNAY